MCEGHHFFGTYLPSYVIFYWFFRLLPPFRLLSFYTKEKTLLQKMVVGKELAPPAPQCLRPRGIKEGYRSTLVVSAFDFQKSWCNVLFQQLLLSLVIPCYLDCVIYFYKPRKRLNSLIFNIEILLSEILGYLLGKQSKFPFKIFLKSTEQHANVC